MHHRKVIKYIASAAEEGQIKELCSVLGFDTKAKSQNL